MKATDLQFIPKQIDQIEALLQTHTADIAHLDDLIRKQNRDIARLERTVRRQNDGIEFLRLCLNSSQKEQTASPQEQAEQTAEFRTQGCKDCKAVRINMAFTPDNYEFIKVMAKATGKSMTDFANDVITAYRNEHPEFLEQARGFLQFVNSVHERKRGYL